MLPYEDKHALFLGSISFDTHTHSHSDFRTARLISGVFSDNTRVITLILTYENHLHLKWISWYE